MYNLYNIPPRNFSHSYRRVAPDPGWAQQTEWQVRTLQNHETPTPDERLQKHPPGGRIGRDPGFQPVPKGGEVNPIGCVKPTPKPVYFVNGAWATSTLVHLSQSQTVASKTVRKFNISSKVRMGMDTTLSLRFAGLPNTFSISLVSTFALGSKYPFRPV